MKNVSRVIWISRGLRTLRARSTSEVRIVYLIVEIQLLATAALLLGHLAVVVRNQLARGR